MKYSSASPIDSSDTSAIFLSPTLTDKAESFKDEEIIQNLTSKNDVIGVLYAQWIPIEVKYKVEHYKQKLNGEYSSIPSERQMLMAIADSQVTPSTKIYSGYTSPTKQTVTVSADGTTVVKYYYKKKLITPIIKNLYIH